MTDIAIPKPQEITAEQASRLAAEIELWVELTDDVALLESWRGQISAIETWLRRRDEAAAVEIARAARKLAVRVGQLLGPAKPGPPESSHACEDSIPREDRHRLRKMAKYADNQAVAAAIERGASQAEVLRIIRYLEDEQRQQNRSEPADARLLHCGVAELVDHVEPGSVDVIVTDPPYPYEFLDCYSQLALTASKILVPGGMLVTLAGQIYLTEVMRRLDDHLAYRWMIAYLTPGGQAAQIWPRKVMQFWKPALVYTNGPLLDEAEWIGDVARSATNDNDKHRHHWGQSESGMRDLMRRVTRAGDLVCDPFLGGGTTAAVALDLGCRFIGSDIAQTAIDATTARLGLT